MVSDCVLCLFCFLRFVLCFAFCVVSRVDSCFFPKLSFARLRQIVILASYGGCALYIAKYGSIRQFGAVFIVSGHSRISLFYTQTKYVFSLGVRIDNYI
mmetsp:Transcript_18414/g.29965  ORF Transcript_18414/g.29965 Transcript_18414/m.29965 type:complete len:99 (-) Transcript_18414:92-388(-)